MRLGLLLGGVIGLSVAASAAEAQTIGETGELFASRSARDTTTDGGALSASVDDIEALSLADLLDTEVSVATKGRAVALRDAPGVVMVLSRDDITRSGARDLLELLQSVPGFDLAIDTYGQTMPGVRGLWAAEGKIQILLDGHELHELVYLMAPLGNRISLDWLERVEIIRGPGSAMYGGAALLGVVNLVTRKAPELDGVAVAGGYSQMLGALAAGDATLTESYGRRNLSASFATRGGSLDFHFFGHAFLGQGQRSDRVYTDAYGESERMLGDYALDPFALDLGADLAGWQLRYFFERFSTSMRDGFDVMLPRAYRVDFLSSSAALSYRAELSPELHLEPEFRWLWQKPWRTVRPDSRELDLYYDAMVNRLQSRLSFDWAALDPSSSFARLSFTGALQHQFDSAFDPDATFVDPDAPDVAVDSLAFHNLGCWLQGELESEWVNAAVGLRVEWHSQFGLAAAPRISLARRFGDAHLKALYSHAYRAPGLANLGLSPDVEPERLDAFELELGYQLGDPLYVALTAFDFALTKPILYAYDADTDTEHYLNGEQQGSSGFELEARWQEPSYRVSASYAFYTAALHEQDGALSVPGRDDELLGFATHKVNARASWDPLPELRLGLGASFASERSAFGSLDDEGSASLLRLSPQWLLDASVDVHDFGVDGLGVTLSAHNLLDDDIVYAQPYDGGHPPLPGASTELMLRLRYEPPNQRAAR